MIFFSFFAQLLPLIVAESSAEMLDLFLFFKQVFVRGITRELHVAASRTASSAQHCAITMLPTQYFFFNVSLLILWLNQIFARKQIN